MGNAISDYDVCCKGNSFVVKNAENDLEAFKRENISRAEKIKKCYTENDQESDNEEKLKRNKEIIDRHFKENSKLNSFNFTKEIKSSSRIAKLKELAKEAPILKIKILNSISAIHKGTVIKINCEGILDYLSERNEKDGFVYFGYNPNLSNFSSYNNSVDKTKNTKLAENKENEILRLDYNIPIGNSFNNTNHDESSVGRHFQIEYKIEPKNYFIKDLGIGYGTFVKLVNPLILRDNYLINVGETFLVINLIEKNEGELSIVSQGNMNSSNNNNNNNVNLQNSISNYKNIHLKVKVFGINYNGEIFYFSPTKHNINIGRYSLADIHITDKLISKIHCVINFSETSGWILYDGFNNKRSMNGSWLYLNDDYEIYDKMIFKSNQNIFQCEFENSNGEEALGTEANSK